jgi:hypothetical protein
MADETIVLTAPFAKGGLTMTISLKVKNGTVTEFTGEDSRGRKFGGCFRFEEIEESTEGKKGTCCCCVDETGSMICRPGSCGHHDH